jgi:hypothetical protein
MQEDQATRSTARCASHPSSPSVALCDSCGRPLCITCAVPVRGQVFGPECLAQVLGPDGATGPRPVPDRPRDLALDLVGIALLGAVLGSVLPWTRFGDPSGTFGGWGIYPQRWSSLASYSGLAGLGLWTWLKLRGRTATLGTALVLLLATTAIVAGAILHVLNPPPFTHAWLGPWVTLGFGILGLASAAVVLRQAVRAKDPNRPAP